MSILSLVLRLAVRNFFHIFMSMIFVVVVLLLTPALVQAGTVNPLTVKAILIHPRSIKEMYLYRDLIQTAAKNGFNTVVIEATGWINYRAFPQVRLPNGFSEADIASLVDFARSFNLDVVPYVVLLTHQQEVAKRFGPHLLLNKETLDVSIPETWEFERKLIDIHFELFHPKMMLIGHDELWGYKDVASVKLALVAGTRRLTPDQFVSHAIKVHDYLATKNVKTIIWGDMFIVPDYGPRGAFGKLYSHTGSHGTNELVSQLERLPKDIVVIDWHYENNATDYPSYDFLKKYGFKVWGASWHEKNNIDSFSKYVSARAGDGMMATTWNFCSEKHRDYLFKFVSESGKTFSKDTLDKP
ncbi:MAG: hypothetical protein WAO71_06215 [Gallionella sp.]